ncbi:CHASE3 domain-containing protein, partial [Xanthobacter sp. DSM 24535]|uniref:CHASE3 domain-containing protein n=1 Tax=Roseixanthobacter psychrophilus TaxID=3119917 RepID=UPI003729799C
MMTKFTTSRFTTARANTAILAILIAVLLLVSAAVWERFTAARLARQWSQHSYLVLNTIQNLGLTIRGAEAAQRGYLLTGDDTYLQPYVGVAGRAFAIESELKQLVAGDAEAELRLASLSPLL